MRKTLFIHFAIFSFAMFFSGCSLFSGVSKKPLTDMVAQPTGNSYTLMIKGAKPITSEITQGLTVNGILDQSGARKKYSRMDIVIKRTIPGKRLRHRMDVDFDPKKRTVPFAQDYSIYPNDIVFIKPDSSTQLDRVVDSLSGVFGSGVK